MTSDPQIAAESPTPAEGQPDPMSEVVIGVLAGQSPTYIEESAQSIHRNRVEGVRNGFDAERARLTVRIKAIDDEIERLNELARTLDADRTKRSNDERELHLVSGQVRALDAEIRAKRYDIERSRLREEVDRLDQQEHAARSLLSVDRRAEYEQELRFWQDTEEERARRTAYLETEKGRAETDLAAAEHKLANVRDRHLTRTLSGFLLWVGYGSAAATGAVTAVLLDNKKEPSAPLADGLRAFRAFILTISPSPSGPKVLLVVGALLLGGMIALGAVVYATDWAISRFDRKWRGGAGRDKSNRVAPLRPPDISRSSYVQLLATFPYVFAMGLLAAIFAAGHDGREDFLVKLFPSLVNTFIGTVLALISAAVFVMYAVKVIEARNRTGEQDWRSAWEFYVLPVVLVIALLTSIASTEAGRPVWGTWAAFMLLSSITLAYGIVYHGLFKDLDKLRWIARRFEDEIRALSAPPLISAPSRQEMAQVKAVARVFSREKERLRLLDQQFSIKRILTAEDSDDFVLLDSWLKSYGNLSRWRRSSASAPSRTYDSYRVLDVEAAPQQVIQREALRSQAAQYQSSVNELQLVIDGKLGLTTPARLDALAHERNSLQADLESSIFEERRVIAGIEVDFANEIQRIRGAIAVGTTVKPAFDEARGYTPPPPAPVIPIHEVRT